MFIVANRSGRNVCLQWTVAPHKGRLVRTVSTMAMRSAHGEFLRSTQLCRSERGFRFVALWIRYAVPSTRQLWNKAGLV